MSLLRVARRTGPHLVQYVDNWEHKIAPTTLICGYKHRFSERADVFIHDLLSGEWRNYGECGPIFEAPYPIHLLDVLEPFQGGTVRRARVEIAEPVRVDECE